MTQVFIKIMGEKIFAQKHLLQRCYKGLLTVLLLALLFSPTVWAAKPAWFNEIQGKSSGAAIYTSAQVEAELVVYAPNGIKPKEEVWFGLKIDHKPEWHTYWKNPGDVGGKTELNWTLPEGLSVSEVQWPTPKVLMVMSLVDYGYENMLLLPVKVQVDEHFNLSEFELKLNANWLACKESCIPEEAELTLNVVTDQSTITIPNLFEGTWKRSPHPQLDIKATAFVEVSAEDINSGLLTWEISGLPKEWQGKELTLYPEQEHVIVNSGADVAGWNGDVWRASYQLNEARKIEPKEVSAVLLFSDEAERISLEDGAGLQIFATVDGIWPAQVVYTIPPSLSQFDDEPNDQANKTPNQSSLAKKQAGSASTALIGILAMALLGGVLLNLMPCVFPVLSIKAISFAQTSGKDRSIQRIGGIAYAAGVVVTMLVLASVLLLLRAGGESLGWGFQLQSPLFISLLAGMFVLIGLNLFGVYEVKVFLPQGVSNLRGKSPAIDSFFSGIVAVLIATPCTAPFLSAALGAALVLPAWQSLLIFLALGIGLALPLVLFAFIPQLANALPRPGVWMITFRQFMAFPIFATVLWLLWVISLQAGADGAIALLTILLAISLLMWVLGWQQKTAAPIIWKLTVVAFAIAMVVGALMWFAPSIKQKPISTTLTERTATTSWQSWSAEKANQALEEGRPVFVNFTAAWCVTCQGNKKSTLGQPNVLKAFADKNVLLLEADWTSRDAAISQELESLGRSGVPVYVLYQAGRDPIFLPEILAPSMVYNMLEQVPES